MRDAKKYLLHENKYLKFVKKIFKMSPNTVKDRLIGKIASIEDENFLNELEEIILNLRNENQDVLILSDEIKASIARSESDIKNGRIMSNDEALKHFKECLKRK